MSVVNGRAESVKRVGLVSVFLAGAVVSLSLGLYAHFHTPSGRVPFTLGFSGLLQMKVWLTTVALVLVAAQLLTALWMWGRLPRAGAAPAWVPTAHRWTGAVAFVVTVPVAFSCIWGLGLLSSSPRVIVHGVAGCLFYGAYAAKMLGLRASGLPGWVLPLLGGAVFSLVVLLWLTAALWFFTRSGIPLV
jgi:hypothetical protein